MESQKQFVILPERIREIESWRNGELLICDDNCMARDSIVVYNIFNIPDSLGHGDLFLYIQEWTNGWIGINENNLNQNDFTFSWDGENYTIIPATRLRSPRARCETRGA